MKPLPEGWRWIKLKSVGPISQGGTPSTEVDAYWNGSIPFVTGADIVGLFVTTGRSFLTDEGFLSGKTGACEKGDLLIVSRTRVGRIGIAGARLGASQDVSIVKVSSGYDSRYLALYLKSLSSELAEACQGATIQGLTKGFLENIQIPLPPTQDDQIAIASELERKLNQVESMRQTAKRELDAISALPGAILQESFDFGG